jgi:hypothetical protein
MVALFLRTELASVRFRGEVLAALGGAAETLITRPDLGNRRDNTVRARILEVHRSYLSRRGLFNHFPRGVRWRRVALAPAELATVHYINYDYWVELSGGSRLPSDGVPGIRASGSHWAIGLGDEFARGAVFPELILVSTSLRGRLVVLEGHARLTAYMMRPEELPAETHALLGTSPDMAQWSLY